MKKFLLIATVLSVGFIQQSTAQKGFSLSAKVTPQASWMINEKDFTNEDIKPQALIGVSFGIGAGYNFSNNFGIAAGALFSLQGGTYDLNNAKIHQIVNYVKVPLLFVYTTPQFGKVSFTGKIGPQANFLVSSTLIDKKGNTLIKNTNDYYAKVTIGGATILGAQFHLNEKFALTAGLRADMDFTNAENENFAGYTTDRKPTLNLASGMEFGVKYQF